MAIGYCPTSKEIMFHNVDYANPKVIQGLLRYYVDFITDGKNNFNPEIIVIYLDIKEAFQHIRISPKQRKAVMFYIQGWTEDDIGKMMNNITHQAVHKLILKVSKKISRYLSIGVAKRFYYTPIL